MVPPDVDDLKAALAQAKACDGAAVVCAKSDRDANLLLPQDMVARFFEVYLGTASLTCAANLSEETDKCP